MVVSKVDLTVLKEVVVAAAWVDLGPREDSIWRPAEGQRRDASKRDYEARGEGMEVNIPP